MPENNSNPDYCVWVTLVRTKQPLAARPNKAKAQGRGCHSHIKGEKNSKNEIKQGKHFTVDNPQQRSSYIDSKSNIHNRVQCQAWTSSGINNNKQSLGEPALHKRLAYWRHLIICARAIYGHSSIVTALGSVKGHRFIVAREERCFEANVSVLLISFTARQKPTLINVYRQQTKSFAAQVFFSLPPQTDTDRLQVHNYGSPLSSVSGERS